MSPLEGLTVAITSYKRPELLQRAISSVRAAGIRRVVVASSEPTEEVMRVIRLNSEGWLSYDVQTTQSDVGCNDTWLLASYRCRTERVLVLHDDDILCPEFSDTYSRLISPELDRGGCFASWRANVLNEDGTFRTTDYWRGPTRSMASRELEKVVAVKGRLSLSPIVSVLSRRVLIDACKEAKQTLTHNDCLHHPGMLLGTEVIVYGRHIRAFPRWFYVDQILSRYGSHPGSGTVQAERNSEIALLAKGYDIARLQCRVAPPKASARIILVHSVGPIGDEAEKARVAVARQSWDYHFGQGLVIELAVAASNLPRTGRDVGDTRDVPFIRDLFDAGCRVATGDDVVVYCNRDILLSADAPHRIIEGVIRGQGATCCHRRKLKPKPGRIYKDFANCRTDGGFDVMAVTPGWWAKHREEMPDMLIGTEAYDTCFRTLVEEIADNRQKRNTVSNSPEQWALSRAYTDNVAGHEPHDSWWMTGRSMNPGQVYNRTLARKFFMDRGNDALVHQLST